MGRSKQRELRVQRLCVGGGKARRTESRPTWLEQLACGVAESRCQSVKGLIDRVRLHPESFVRSLSKGDHDKGWVWKGYFSDLNGMGARWVWLGQLGSYCCCPRERQCYLGLWWPRGRGVMWIDDK